MSNRRKIVVDDIEYTWMVGSTRVEIRGPDKYKRLPDYVEASGGYYSYRDYEKKSTRITPSMIAEYIRQDRKKVA